MTTTQTGIPVADCATCGHRHPVTRSHCRWCGLATLYGHLACHPAQGDLLEGLTS